MTVIASPISRATPHAARFSWDDLALRLVYDDGLRADFHWIWLRHACPLDVHETTGEPTLCPSTIPADIRPIDVRLDAGEIEIRWREPDRAPTRFSLAALRDWANGHNDASEPASDVARFEVPRGTRAPEIVARLRRDGAVLVRDPNGVDAHEHATERWIEQLAGAGLKLVETHFGRIEDLRPDTWHTHTNSDQLGYTSAGIDLHTDQPFLARPPRYQLLHGLVTAPRGGDTILADGDAAARWLAANDADAFETLLHTPVPFVRRQKQFEKTLSAPVLERRGDRLFVRCSYFTMRPPRLSFAHVTGFYRAYARFLDVLRTHHVRTRLEPGDVLLYDNHRMLHGRTAFEGLRWVRGVYFDEPG